MNIYVIVFTPAIQTVKQILGDLNLNHEWLECGLLKLPHEWSSKSPYQKLINEWLEREPLNQHDFGDGLDDRLLMAETPFGVYGVEEEFGVLTLTNAASDAPDGWLNEEPLSLEEGLSNERVAQVLQAVLRRWATNPFNGEFSMILDGRRVDHAECLITLYKQEIFGVSLPEGWEISKTAEGYNLVSPHHGVVKSGSKAEILAAIEKAKNPPSPLLAYWGDDNGNRYEPIGLEPEGWYQQYLFHAAEDDELNG